MASVKTGNVYVSRLSQSIIYPSYTLLKYRSMWEIILSSQNWEILVFPINILLKHFNYVKITWFPHYYISNIYQGLIKRLRGSIYADTLISVMKALNHNCMLTSQLTRHFQSIKSRPVVSWPYNITNKSEKNTNIQTAHV